MDATAWPAFADLMTVLAVVGLSAAVVVLAYAKNQVSKIEELEQELADKEKRLADKEMQNDNLEGQIEKLNDEKIGFIPCWPRSQGAGWQYYFAYNITYANDLFRITAHRDLDKIIEREPIDAKGLHLLKNFPIQHLDRNELIEFGKKIAAWKESVYSNGCRLVTTLNPEAPVEIGNFVSKAVGLYPIGLSQ